MTVAALRQFATESNDELKRKVLYTGRLFKIGLLSIVDSYQKRIEMDINCIEEIELKLVSLLSNYHVIHQEFAEQMNKRNVCDSSKRQEFEILFDYLTSMVDKTLLNCGQEIIKLLKHRMESINHNNTNNSNHNKAVEESNCYQAIKQNDPICSIPTVLSPTDSITEEIDHPQEFKNKLQEQIQSIVASIDNEESAQSQASMNARPSSRRKTRIFYCTDCNESFRRSKDREAHNCEDDESDSDAASDDITENTNSNKPKTHNNDNDGEQIKKHKSTAKNTNNDGSKRAKYLPLAEALDEYRNTGSMDGWSPARITAWMNRVENPNGFYYRFNAIGLSPNEKRQLELMRDTKEGAWGQNEEKSFMQRVLECGVNIEWGTFSEKIPGRVGYTCSGHWRTLMKKGCVRDLNYFKKGNDYVYKWSPQRRNDDDRFMQCKKYGFMVIADPSNVWSKTRRKHPKFPKGMKESEMIEMYSKYLTSRCRNACEKRKQRLKRKRNDNDGQSQKRKRRKTERKESDEESEED